MSMGSHKVFPKSELVIWYLETTLTKFYYICCHKYSIPLLVIVVHFTVLIYKLNFIIGGNNKTVYYVQG